jgi:tetratricopeptide (TPR) repeat protein
MAWVSYELAWAVKNLGDPEEAVRLYLESGEMWERLSRMSPEDPLARRKASSYWYDAAVVLAEHGRQDEALAAHEKALAIRRAVAVKHPVERDPIAAVADSLLNIGRLQAAANRIDEAISAHREAEDLWGAIMTRHPSDQEAICNQIDNLLTIGWLRKGQGGLTEAIATVGSVRDHLSGWEKGRPVDSKLLWRRARVEIDLAVLLTEANRLLEAQGHFVAGSQSCLELIRSDPPRVATDSDLSSLLGSLAVLLAKDHASSEGWATYARIVEEWTSAVEADPRLATHAVALAGAYRRLADMCRDTDRFDEAARRYEAAIRWLEPASQAAADDLNLRFSLSHHYAALGHCWRERGQFETAAKAYERACAIRAEVVERRPDDAYRVGVFGFGWCEAAEGWDLAGNIEASLAALDQAINAFDRLRALESSSVWLNLAPGAQRLRTMQLERLGRNDEPSAMRDAQALERSSPSRQLYRLWNLSRSHAQFGAIRQALETSDLLEPGPFEPGETSYLRGFLNSLAAEALARQAIADGRSIPSHELEQLQNEAMRQLGLARAAGFFTRPKGLGYLRTDKDIDPLRGRADFQSFTREVWEELDAAMPTGPAAFAR